MTGISTNTESWNLLNAELDAWFANGQVATFWWRDDDAVAPGPSLDRLLDLTKTSGLLLAVIPAHTGPELVSAVASLAHVKVGQHGYAHINHAQRGQGQGAWELGLHRGIAAVMADLVAGQTQLTTLFDSQFVPVVIPPWNHIDPALFEPVAASGFCGVSLFGSRASELLVGAQDFAVVNAHCDPIHWKTGPRFTGESKAIAQLLKHLAARRTGSADVAEATGVLTHHIDLDEQSWLFCTQLERLLTRHPAARWCHPDELFGTSSAAETGE